MNKSKLNLSIDMILLILLAGISGIGFLVKFIMPCGHAVRNGGAHTYASQMMGMDRHGWNDIHWILGLIFLVFLLLHIVLHWKMINTMFKQLIPHQGTRSFVVALLILIVVLCMCGPFLYML